MHISKMRFLWRRMDEPAYLSPPPPPSSYKALHGHRGVGCPWRGRGWLRAQGCSLPPKMRSGSWHRCLHIKLLLRDKVNFFCQNVKGVQGAKIPWTIPKYCKSKKLNTAKQRRAKLLAAQFVRPFFPMALCVKVTVSRDFNFKFFSESAFYGLLIILLAPFIFFYSRKYLQLSCSRCTTHVNDSGGKWEKCFKRMFFIYILLKHLYTYRMILLLTVQFQVQTIFYYCFCWPPVKMWSMSLNIELWICTEIFNRENQRFGERLEDYA